MVSKLVNEYGKWFYRDEQSLQQETEVPPTVEEDEHIPNDVFLQLRESVMFGGDPEYLAEKEALGWSSIPPYTSSLLPQINYEQSEKTRGFVSTERFKRLLSVADFYEEQPPVNWIVEDLIAPGNVTTFYGLHGSMKSWVVYDLAVCVAAGQTWAGMYQTRAARVLIIDEENGRRRVNNRFARIIKGHGLDQSMLDGYLAVSTMQGINLGKGKDMQALEELLTLNNIDLLIIDSQAAVTNGLDDSQEKDMRPFHDALKHLAERTQVAIIILHHTDKEGKKYRGSAAILDTVDQGFSVQCQEKEARLTFKSAKLRDGKSFSFSIKAHFDEDDRFWFSPSSRAAQQAEPQKNDEDKGDTQKSLSLEQQKVVGFLSENGPSLMLAITDTCDVSRQLVYDLIKLGIVYRVDGGNSGARGLYGLVGVHKPGL